MSPELLVTVMPLPTDFAAAGGAVGEGPPLFGAGLKVRAAGNGESGEQNA